MPTDARRKAPDTVAWPLGKEADEGHAILAMNSGQGRATANSPFRKGTEKNATTRERNRGEALGVFTFTTRRKARAVIKSAKRGSSKRTEK